jgi:DNA-directed RNA polymerase subunit RPC12/RpoP
MAKYEDSEEITCPVCGKPVGLDVPSCPHCGAEFEEEEESQPGAPKPITVAAAEIEEDVACPVCGKAVGLDVAACPHCGAEFEEEEIEEVIEVEEKQVEVEEEVVAPKAAARSKARSKAVEEAEEAEEATAESLELTSILDFRVIGVSLILLGLIGSQIAIFIDWYWGWVPPIEDNLAMFLAIAAVVVVVGLMVWMLVKKFASDGKKVPSMMPSVSLSLFLFGIFALILVLMWDPINSALQDSQMLVAVVFVAILAAGIGLMFLGTRESAKAACD